MTPRCLVLLAALVPALASASSGFDHVDLQSKAIPAGTRFYVAPVEAAQGAEWRGESRAPSERELARLHRALVDGLDNHLAVVDGPASGVVTLRPRLLDAANGPRDGARTAVSIGIEVDGLLVGTVADVRQDAPGAVAKREPFAPVTNPSPQGTTAGLATPPSAARAIAYADRSTTAESRFSPAREAFRTWGDDLGTFLASDTAIAAR